MSNRKNDSSLKRELSKLKADYELARGMGLSAEGLRSEQDFFKYLRLLKAFAKRYTVFIVASDTPCGPAFTDDVAAEVMMLGLKTNLSGKFRMSYAAIIDAGEVVYEHIASSVTEPVEYELDMGSVHVKLESIGFDVPKINGARVVIDGKNRSTGGRGLNFVVFDIVTKTLLDAVNFDTYSDHLPCKRPSEMADKLLKYASAHPEISVMCFGFPAFPDSNLSANEKFILDNAIGRSTVLQNIDKPIFAINKYFKSPEEIIEVLNAPSSYHDITGTRRFDDYHGKCVNITNGHRVTSDQPDRYARTIYTVGGCGVFGIGSSDAGTIASHLQRLFNEFAPEQEIIVQNYGYFLAEMGDALTGEEMSIVNSLPVKAGDIVLCNFGMSDKLPSVSMGAAARRPP